MTLVLQSSKIVLRHMLLRPMSLAIKDERLQPKEEQVSVRFLFWVLAGKGMAKNEIECGVLC